MKVKSVLSAFLMLCVLGGPLGTKASAGTYKTIENSSPQEIVGGMGTKLNTKFMSISTQLH